MTETRAPQPRMISADTMANIRPFDAILKPRHRDNFIRNVNRTLDMVATNGVHAEEAANLYWDNPARAQSDVQYPQSGNVLDYLNEVIEVSRVSDMSPEEAAERVRNASENQQRAERSLDYFIESQYTAGNPNFNPIALMHLERRQILQEALQAEFERTQDQGFARSAWQFIDYALIRGLSIGLYEDLSRRSERVGNEILNKLQDDRLSDEEFREWAKNIAVEYSKEGIFTDQNWLALGTAFHEVENMGYDPLARLVQGLTVAGATVSGARVVGRAANVGSTTVGRVSVAAGVDEATAVGSRLATSGAADTVAEVADSILPGTLAQSRSPGAIVANIPRINQIMEENDIILGIRELWQSGAIARVIPEEELNALAQAERLRVSNAYDNPVIDSPAPIPNEFGGYTMEIHLGRTGTGDDAGKVFKDVDEAEDLAQEIGDSGFAVAEVRLVDPDNIDQGWTVVVSTKLDVDTAASAADMARVSDGILTNIFGSSRAVDPAGTELAQMGGSLVGAVTQIVKPHLDNLSRLDPRVQNTIDTIMVNVRDGTWLNGGRVRWKRNLTDNEFAIEFNRIEGRLPTQAEIDAYHSAISVSDAAYALSSVRVAEQLELRGFKSVDINGFRTVGRAVERPSPNTTIYDPVTQTTLPASRLPSSVQVWKLEDAVSQDIKYIINPTKVSHVDPMEAVGYAPGGRRVYQQPYFVTLGDNIEGRAILTAASEKVAIRARDELKNIFAEFKRLAVNSIDDLVDELDEVIKRNNSWNKSIRNTADFVKYASRRGWKLGDDVSYKRSGGMIDDADHPFHGMSEADVMAFRNRRSDIPLDEVNSRNSGRVYSPVRSMVEQLNNVSQDVAFRASNYASKTAFLRAAGVKLRRGDDVNTLFKNFDIKGLKSTSKNRKLLALHNTIRRRDGFKGPVHEFMDMQGEKLRDWVFDTAGKRIGNISVDSVQGKLLGFGFQSAFGFLNTAQFFLQASHGMTIAMISPRHGLKAASMVIPLRLAMNAPEGAVRKLAVQRLAKAVDMTSQDLEDFWYLLRTSGRDLVDGDALEKGTGAGFGLSSWSGEVLLPSAIRANYKKAARVGGRALDLGLMPFNEGERLSRHTGMLAAFLEYKAKHPGLSVNTAEARRWISAREQTLTFNMTTEARGAWQSGFMKLPTQWLSYSMRYMEAILLKDAGFTNAERARLVLWMAMSGGMAGMGLGWAIDSMTEWLGVEPGSNAEANLQSGVVDAILSWGFSAGTGEDIRTAMGSRIAPFTAFTDLYRKVTEESTITALAGPSGEIASAGVSAVVDVVGGLINGDREIPRESLERVARNMSGIDNMYKAWSMAKHGYYQSRTGIVLPMEFSGTEAFLQGLGVSNYRVTEFYRNKTQLFRDSRDLRSFRTEVYRYFDEAVRIYKEDPERGLRMMDEVGARITVSNFSHAEQRSLRMGLLGDRGDVLNDMIMQALRNSDFRALERLEALK